MIQWDQEQGVDVESCMVLLVEDVARSHDDQRNIFELKHRHDERIIMTRQLSRLFDVLVTNAMEASAS